MNLRLVNEYQLKPGDQEAIRALLAASFPDAAFTATRTYLKQFSQRRLLAFDDGLLVGHLGLEHRVIGTKEGPREIMGIVDVCVAQRMRGQGLASSMLSWIENLARQSHVPYLVLFAQDARLYQANGFFHAKNVLRWVMINEHEIIGVAEEPLEELMVKNVSALSWPNGLVDLLGHQF